MSSPPRTSAKEQIQRLLRPYYTEATVTGPNGASYAALDATKLYLRKELFSKYFASAKRSAPVYVWHPKAGDTITESGRTPIVSNGTETVFIKKLGEDGPLKMYIPSDPSGPLNESILDEKYAPGIPAADHRILATLPDGASIMERKTTNLAIDILHECITKPTVILHARGEGKHQFMNEGDSLKFEDGACLPLPKQEIDTAWKVSPKSRSI